jgi:hypothetical protein
MSDVDGGIQGTVKVNSIAEGAGHHGQASARTLDCAVVGRAGRVGISSRSAGGIELPPTDHCGLGRGNGARQERTRDDKGTRYAQKLYTQHRNIPEKIGLNAAAKPSTNYPDRRVAPDEISPANIRLKSIMNDR